MEPKKDFYEVLGVEKDADAKTIKRAFLKLARKLHPDVSDDPDAEEKFKEVNEAYSVLSDDQKRANYDRYGDPNGPAGFGSDYVDVSDIFGGSGFGFGDIFDSFFGGGRGGAGGTSARTHGRDMGIHLQITLEEAAAGCAKTVAYERLAPCDDCGGTGAAKGTTAETCPNCRGTGVVTQTQRTPLGMFQTQGACPNCRGTGKIIHQPCPDCRGSGRIRKRRTIQVTIPAGIDNGQTISLRGQGHAGSNGGPSGDLLITVMVRPHEIFRREGTSVFCEAPITFTQAVLGAELEIPTIDGRVKYTIPEGTQTGTVFRLRGKGIPVLNGRGRGDQYVTVTIETPRDLNREQKEALKRFSETLGEGNYEKHRSFFGKKK